MKLLFLGRGAGFNPSEGSTSSYFIDHDEMFLIDCGESIFHAILNKKILDTVSKINLFITHTHSDHVGSLGSLILYAYAVKKIEVRIVVDTAIGYLDSIRSLLTIYGLTGKMYQFINASALNGLYSSFSKVSYFKTKHCDELESCGILFKTEKGLVFYSGDMNDPEPLVKIIDSGRRIDKIYIDTNNDRHPNPHHISIHLLNEILPAKYKPRVYCMHIKNNQCIVEAKAYGFKIVNRQK